MSATRPPNLDDRFSTPIEASRRGAHRARPKPASAGLPVVAGAAVILLVLGGGYAVLKGGDGVSDSSSNRAAAAAVDDGDAASTATATGGADAGATTAPAAAAETTKAEAPAATSTKAPTASINRDLTLKVLNSTSTSGLAKRVQADIEPDGWSVAETGNSINRNLSVTKVYYGRTADRASALGLVKDLGFGTAVRDAGVVSSASRLVVVLGADAR